MLQWKTPQGNQLAFARQAFNTRAQVAPVVPNGFAMPSQVNLNAYDFAVFALYILATVALGFWVAAGRRKKTARGYFLGDKSIP